MTPRRRTITGHTRVGLRVLQLLLVFGLVATAFGHPLGNFTINHFSRIEVAPRDVRIRYVVDLAEIPTFEVAQAIDADRDGALSAAELNAYLESIVPQYLEGLRLTVGGERLNLAPVGKSVNIAPGAGGLPTLRVVCDLTGTLPRDGLTDGARFRYADTNHRERAGWHELVVTPGPGVTIFDSSAYGSGVTDELKAYPEDLLMAPLDERAGEWSAARRGAPAGARPLQTRDGKPVRVARDRLAELIAVPALTPGVALFGLLLAFGLGGLHALSPGHGKTIVGAYLVGSRGSARDAAFLGLTVTVTHTIGVFALGLVTLFASRYVLPERLYPILSFASGALVVVIGVWLFVKRLGGALGEAAWAHDHDHDHGGLGHSHLPPGGAGSAVSWRGLLALGVSGGLLPCPSALVVLLAAISLHRVGYGLLLIVAFSLGLAAILTAVGLAFVYAGRYVQPAGGAGRLARVIPIFSALVITAAGLIICYEALTQGGANLSAAWSQPAEPTGLVAIISILGYGLVLGLRHAMDADHLAAVSTIVSERKSLLSSSLVGGLWGVGHTLSLLLAGVAVILLNVQVGDRLRLSLEFCVALMLIGLGVNALLKLARGDRLHWHAHRHGEQTHSHPHLHGQAQGTEAHSHHGLRIGFRPLIIGMVHGLAGSATLMLLVLSTINSPALGLAYIIIFGIGSIGGMMLMSLLLGLPAHLTADRFSGANLAVRALAGFFSLGFGLFMVYEIGFVEGLLR